MDLDAIIMMVIGIVVIWGGLVGSVLYAVVKARRG